jgi:6-phosphogluconolactonase
VNLAVEIEPGPGAAAGRVGELVLARAREAIAERGRFSLAVSKAPPALLRVVAEGDHSWAAMRIYQVDERVAPAGDADRNLTCLLAALPDDAAESVLPMPVEDRDLEEAAHRYEAQLPAQLDLVHLGLGSDGHTASLVPGDPVLQVRDRLVAVTGAYQGRCRMTLTYPALAAAREIVWLITGDEKRAAVARLLARDTAIPAARIANPRQLVVCDAAAAALLS